MLLYTMELWYRHTSPDAQREAREEKAMALLELGSMTATAALETCPTYP